MNNQSQPTTAQSLFASAKDAGILAGQAAAVVTAPDLGLAVQNALGVAANDVPSSNVTAVILLFDNSSSIRDEAGNEQAVRDGANLFLDALMDSKEHDGIIVAAFLFNGANGQTLLYPFTPIEQAPRLDANNYRAYGSTPLRDRLAEGVALGVAKEQEFAASGVPARTITVVLTDGADYGSRHTEAEVEVLVRAARKTEQHLHLAMCVSDGVTDFRAVFRRLGFLDANVLVVGNTPSEIRRACGAASRSVIRNSVASPGATVAGGFGTP